MPPGELCAHSFLPLALQPIAGCVLPQALRSMALSKWMGFEHMR